MSLITFLTRIHFADRALEDALPAEIARNGFARPLLLAGHGASQSDGLDRLLDALPASVSPATCIVQDGGVAISERAHAQVLMEEADCDGILGLGGMGVLDLARTLSDASCPVITIPTHTNSVGLGPLGVSAGLRPGRRATVPVAVLCDPTLTTATTELATAAAGMDALVHCLESFLSTTFNPPADGIALDGLRRAASHLEAAVQNGSDRAARRELLIAALDAGLAAEKGFGAIEAASHGIEAVMDAPHGMLHGALFSEVLAFNAPAVSDRFDAVRAALELSSQADIGAALTGLGRRVGLPSQLSDLGVATSLLPDAARIAAADPASRTNPRHATEKDYERIMHAAL